MVTWWLVGQEEQRRDSLTGINMIRSDGGVQSRKNGSPMTDAGGVNMMRSEGGLPPALAMKLTDIGIVRSDGGRQSQMISLSKKDGIRMGRNGSGRRSCSAAMNGAGVNKARSDGGLQFSSKRRGSIPVTKSEGGFPSPKKGLPSPKRGLARNEVSIAESANEDNLNPERKSYSKIVSFNGGGHSQNSSSSQEQLDQNLPLPGTVMSDNEPLL